MNRRAFLAALSGSLLAAPLVAEAQRIASRLEGLGVGAELGVQKLIKRRGDSQ